LQGEVCYNLFIDLYAYRRSVTAVLAKYSEGHRPSESKDY